MKRRSNGEGNIRQREDKTWEGRILIDGKRKSVYGKTRNEVRQKLTEIQWEADNTLYIHEPSKLTVEEWMQTWLATCTGRLTHSSMYERRQYARLYVLPYIGDKKLKDLCPTDVRVLYNKLVQRGLSENTIKNTRTVLHSSLQQAMNDGIVKKNVSSKIPIPHSLKPTKEIHPLSDEEIAVFLDAIRDYYWGPLFFIDLFTGLRKSEIIGLTWDCVDFDKQTIYVYRQLRLMEGKGVYEFTEPKNKKPRMVYPPQCVFDMLRFVQRRQAEQKLQLGELWSNPNDFVFTQENGSHTTHKGIFAAFKKIVKKMGIPNTRLHDLRHTFATVSIQNGADPKTVSEMLGHATVEFTLDVYTHMTDTSARKAAKAMDNYVNNIKLG